MQQKPIKRNGYFYGPHTRAGFLRMQRMGIPQPPFRLENKLTKKLVSFFQKELAKMIRDFEAQARVVVTDHALTQDGALEELMDFFDQMAKEEAANTAAAEKIKNRMQVNSAAISLQEQWRQEQEQSQQSDTFNDMTAFMQDYLQEDTKEFYKKFNADASDELLRVIDSFSIDKKKLFEENQEALRKLYIDNSQDRLNGEIDELKKHFLRKLNEYVRGESDSLDIAQEMRDLEASAERMARFFARDQMSRFNKALTLSTYLSAGVKSVKWVTCHDARVRETHKALDGRIFQVNNLPPELDDYNCRCGLVPVEYEN